ncbi:MAG: hypothetical protein ACRDVP_11635 [Acidimicrobiales bacterium]
MPLVGVDRHGCQLGSGASSGRQPWMVSPVVPVVAEMSSTIVRRLVSG